MCVFWSVSVPFSYFLSLMLQVLFFLNSFTSCLCPLNHPVLCYHLFPLPSSPLVYLVSPSFFVFCCVVCVAVYFLSLDSLYCEFWILGFAACFFLDILHSRITSKKILLLIYFCLSKSNPPTTLLAYKILSYSPL